MRDLCIFDLDGTLIEHDSFARIVRANLFSSPSLLAMAVARRAGLLSRSKFAEQAHRVLQPKMNLELVEYIVQTTNQVVIADRLQIALKHKSYGALMVLLSASPEDYVKPLGSVMGFDMAFGSHWDDGKYRHLHGEEKLAFADQHFPRSQYNRVFAMADQPSDEPLMQTFEDAQRV